MLDRQLVVIQRFLQSVLRSAEDLKHMLQGICVSVILARDHERLPVKLLQCRRHRRDRTVKEPQILSLLLLVRIQHVPIFGFGGFIFLSDLFAHSLILPVDLGTFLPICLLTLRTASLPLIDLRLNLRTGRTLFRLFV